MRDGVEIRPPSSGIAEPPALPAAYKTCIVSDAIVSPALSEGL